MRNPFAGGEHRAGRRGGATVHRFPGRPFLLIGRDPRSDLCLDDDRVSKRHAYLQAVGGRLYCADLGSRTGVHWPSGPQASGWVDWEEPLRIGGAVIRLASPSADGLTEPGAAPRAVFEVSGGAAGTVAWTMNRPVALVGGAAGCKVRLPDPHVSRFHCSLVRGPLGVGVVDLMSRIGTQVGGRSVPWSCLQDGDRLQVGPYVFRLRYEPSDGRDDRRLTPRAAGADRALLTTSATIDRALLLPVIHEFNQMQQSMLDQFHQTMMMMAEMFTTLHKEQAALVREELEHLRRLTRELNTLQAEQTRQSIAGRRLPLLEGPAAAESAAVEEGRSQPQDAPEMERAHPEPAIAAKTKAAPEKAPDPSTEAPRKPAPADVHDWLARRIDQLQTERQGRWQKLMRLVTGR